MSEVETKAEVKVEKKKSRLKKIFLWVLISLIAVLMVVVISIVAFIDQIATTAIRNVTPYFTGTEVTVSSVNFSLASGTMSINSLVIGNPEGYSTPSAIQFDEFTIDLKLDSLLTDCIEINEVRIINPRISMELSLTGNSNLKDIQKNLESVTAKTEADAPVEEPVTEEEVVEADAQKQVIIRKLIIDGAVITVASKELGAGVPILLAPIELNDIGENGDTSIVEATNMVFTELLTGITGALKNSKIDESVGAAIDSLSSGLDSGVEGVSKGVNNLINVFSK